MKEIETWISPHPHFWSAQKLEDKMSWSTSMSASDPEGNWICFIIFLSQLELEESEFTEETMPKLLPRTLLVLTL